MRFDVVFAFAGLVVVAASTEMASGHGADNAHHFADSFSTDANGAAPQFVVQGGKWPQPGGLGSPITLTYSYENMFDGALKMPGGVPLPASLIRQSVETALGLWADVVPIHFVEVPDDGKEYFKGAAQYGQLRFRHVFINGPDPPNGQPIPKAQAYFPFSGDPYAGDVEFDHGDPWQEVGTISVPDILGAMTHELGHSLGLGHTDIPSANMYWIFRRTKGLHDGWLHPDDIAGMLEVYGPGQGSVTPLVIPEPATLAFALVVAVSFVARRRAR
jgi:hypothetical protein